MAPRMCVVAGPPGSGKSTAFPVSGFGVDCFNADDTAAELNGGSYLAIPQPVRDEVNRRFESFVLDHIQRRVSCAFESTLRSDITFRQAELARMAGFVVEMRYLALRDFRMHVERVKMRADDGGHSASERTLRRIYDSSTSNLSRAILEMDSIRVYDNSRWRVTPELLLRAAGGKIEYQATSLPPWLTKAVK